MPIEKTKYAVLFALCAFALSTSMAQERFSYLNMGVQAHYGFIMIHSEEVRPIEDSYPFGLGVEFLKTNGSARSWDQCKCFPSLGVSLTYWNLDNPDVLGYAVSSIFFLEPEFAIWKKLHFSFRFGLGLSYLSNPYDSISNPDNLSYSTHLAFPVQASLYLNYAPNNRWKIRLGAEYNHISNGGLKNPTRGLIIQR
jgi:hypothetical protein